MAYTIGSEKGKEIAKNMTVGSTYKASDGSTWTKKADGSVSVTHQGVTTNNAYTAPATSTGGSTSSGTSNRYASTGGDIGTYGKNQMASGTNWQDVLQTYYDRQNKAMTTQGLGQYANDALQTEMWNYIQNAQKAEQEQAVQDYLDNFNYTEEKPTYEAKYDPALQELLNNILNRDDFSYDVTKDPLYQQYAAMYQQEGDRAMQETLANAAASAGGMNSYAITAAQQAGNYYSSQLANKVPELYQLAYEMYLQDKDSMVQDLGILQGLDETQYNRYRDTMSDFYNDKNFAYGVYKDAVTQGNWQQNFDYNQLVDDRNFNYGITQDNVTNSWREQDRTDALTQQELENKRYDDALKREDADKVKQQAREEAYALLELGQMPPSALLEAAGIDEAYASAYIKGIQAELARQTSSSGYTGDQKVYDDKKQFEDDDGYTEDKIVTDVTEHPRYNDGSVEGLGAGMINDATLKQIAAKGGLTTDENGGVYWADGWNAHNWQEKMKSPFSNLATDILMNGLYNL